MFWKSCPDGTYQKIRGRMQGCHISNCGWRGGARVRAGSCARGHAGLGEGGGLARWQPGRGAQRLREVPLRHQPASCACASLPPKPIQISPLPARASRTGSPLSYWPLAYSLRAAAAPGNRFFFAARLCCGWRGRVCGASWRAFPVRACALPPGRRGARRPCCPPLFACWCPAVATGTGFLRLVRRSRDCLLLVAQLQIQPDLDPSTPSVWGTSARTHAPASCSPAAAQQQPAARATCRPTAAPPLAPARAALWAACGRLGWHMLPRTSPHSSIYRHFFWEGGGGMHLSARARARPAHCRCSSGSSARPAPSVRVVACVACRRLL